MAISLPEAKRAGPTILFGELLSQFGSRVVRLASLHRIRGNIEHFRSANMLWSFFNGPIYGRMCFADETNTWINCGSRHLRYAFWSATEIVRIIRRNKHSWGKLFAGELEWLLPHEHRFECAQKPEDIAGYRPMPPSIE